MTGTLCKCKKVTYVGQPGHAVDAVCNRCSMQWMQYTVDAVHSGRSSGIWWWGHCLWCKKVKPVDAVDAVSSTQWNSGIWWWGHCLWCKKAKPVDAVDAVTQWTQWMQYAVHSSGIVVYGGGDIVLWCKKFIPVDAVLCGCSTQYAVCSEIVVYDGGDIVFGAKRPNQWMQWMQYAVDAVE